METILKNRKLVETLVIGFAGGILTLARRFRNQDPSAGMGIAGWSMFLIILLWV